MYKKTITSGNDSHLGKALDLYNGGQYIDALDLLKPLAEKEFSEAQQLLGDAYQNGNGTNIDIELAWFWYRKSYEHGNAKAAYWLGFLCDPSLELSNETVEKDRSKNMEMSLKYYKEAVKRFRRDADKGDAEAMHWLATCYQSGTGVKWDIREAIKWLTLAFDNGFAFAANDLFSIYSQKESPWRNEKKAHFYYKQTKEHGCQAVYDKLYE